MAPSTSKLQISDPCQSRSRTQSRSRSRPESRSPEPEPQPISAVELDSLLKSCADEYKKFLRENPEILPPVYCWYSEDEYVKFVSEIHRPSITDGMLPVIPRAGRFEGLARSHFRHFKSILLANRCRYRRIRRGVFVPELLLREPIYLPFKGEVVFWLS